MDAAQSVRVACGPLKLLWGKRRRRPWRNNSYKIRLNPAMISAVIPHLSQPEGLEAFLCSLEASTSRVIHSKSSSWLTAPSSRRAAKSLHTSTRTTGPIRTGCRISFEPCTHQRGDNPSATFGSGSRSLARSMPYRLMRASLPAVSSSTLKVTAIPVKVIWQCFAGTLKRSAPSGVSSSRKTKRDGLRPICQTGGPVR